MKYIIASLCLVMLASCSWSNPFGRNPDSTNTPVTQTGGVGVTDSGATSGSEDDAVSTQTGIIVTPPTDGSSGTTTVTTSSGRDMPVTKTGAINTQTSTTNNPDVDPEIQNITDDINKIFDDIGKESK